MLPVVGSAICWWFANLFWSRRRGRIVGGGDAGGEFEDLDVAEVDFGSFGFEADVAFFLEAWEMPLTNFPLTESFMMPSIQTTW